MRCALSALFLMLGVVAVAQPPKDTPPMKARTGPAFAETPYGKVPNPAKAGDTLTITEYTLTNRNGVEVKCITYGAIVTEISVPDKNGKFADVALGFDKLDGYLTR